MQITNFPTIKKIFLPRENPALSENVIKIAFSARQIVEDFAKNNPSIGNTENLRCYCAIGSKILYDLLKKANLNPIFVEGNFDKEYHSYNFFNHCWVEIDGYIVDITATQFGFKDKVLVTKKNSKIGNYYLSLKTGKSAFIHISKDWRDQAPQRYSKVLGNLYKRISS